MRFNTIKVKEQASFKRRKFIFYTPTSPQFGNIGLFFSKNKTIEYTYLFFLKKILKIFFKLKFSNLVFFKYWIFLKGNFPITKKSKNARMGKGKGVFLRWTIKILLNFLFFEILSIKNKYFLKVLKQQIFFFSNKCCVFFK